MQGPAVTPGESLLAMLCGLGVITWAESNHNTEGLNGHSCHHDSRSSVKACLSVSHLSEVISCSTAAVANHEER